MGSLYPFRILRRQVDMAALLTHPCVDIRFDRLALEVVRKTGLSEQWQGECARNLLTPA
jgi:hypothetical protein